MMEVKKTADGRDSADETAHSDQLSSSTTPPLNIAQEPSALRLADVTHPEDALRPEVMLALTREFVMPLRQ